MKKFIVCLFLIAGSLFLFCACGDKTPATPQEFQSVMESYGYQFVDISDQYEAGYTAYLAVAPDSSYQIEYYQLPSADLALQAYTVNRDDFDSQKGDTNTVVETNGANSAKYALSTAGTYYFVSYIQNTMVYITAPDTFKDQIKEAIEELGY